MEKFETCPKQFYHLKVARDTVEPTGEAAEWGSRVHSAIESYLVSAVKLPEGMQQWEPVVAKFDALPGEKFVEYKFAVDKNFQPTEWSSAWARGIADYVIRRGSTVMVADWKTGKKKPTEQLDLYAAFAKAYWPEVTKVHTAFVWLKTKDISKETIEESEFPIIWQKMLPRMNRLEAAYEKDVWPARPSGLCNGWCAVKTCNHWKEKRR